MELFSDYYQDFPNPIGTSWPIFDFQDKEFQYDIVTEHLPDRQCIEFSPDVGKASPDSCDIIATHYNNLSNGAGNNAPLYLYESTMESFGLQEIINPGSMPSNEQVAAAAVYASSVGADHGKRPAYPVPQRTGREEITTCDANHLLYHTPGGGSSMELVSLLNKTTSWEVKDRKTDPVHISKSVFETNVPVPLKKSNRDRCKSWPDSSASRDREEKLNPAIDVIRRDPLESLSNIVTNDQRAESRKDYIHVRARRGQATDNHSLAERVRRQKINDRMNILQNLVPDCNTITNKALVLEEIIKYVHSLQNQVEILSMKLASITPNFTFDNQIGHHFKELLPLEATKDPMFAYRLAPHYVDDSHTVTYHRTPGTFI